MYSGNEISLFFDWIYVDFGEDFDGQLVSNTQYSVLLGNSSVSENYTAVSTGKSLGISVPS